MENHIKAKERFTAYLKENKLSCSKKRISLIDLVGTLSHHFDAEELVQISKEKGIEISRATVFRNLSLLEEAGIIRKVQFTDRHSHFEYTYTNEHHEHLICLKCKKIFDFSNQLLEKTIDNVANIKGFKQISHKIEIIGICAQCQ